MNPPAPSSAADRQQPPTASVSLWTWLVGVRHDAEAWSDVLDDEERAAASRILPPVHRARFVARRAMRRHVLAACVRRPPADLRFRSGAYGKPVLIRSGSRAVPFFNMSRSGDLIVLALSWTEDIGIDIEEVRPFAENVGGLFAPDERRRLATLPASEVSSAVFRYWTAKEAAVKLLGTGFSMPPEAVKISDPADPLRLLSIDGDPRLAATIHLHPFAVHEVYTGTIATRSQRIVIEHRVWQEPDI